MLEIKMPNGAHSILQTLLNNGFDSYIVGGCVRDSLLGICPKDWDICTSAKPQEIIECFNGRRVIETGLKHGTVTLCMDDGFYEVTTFRVDGAYSDNRHPDNVTFVSDVKYDLERRDFSINAMAYNANTGLIDLFGGVDAIKAGLISCVGNPNDRFNEDGLRILRALRFASVYGFSISAETAAAIHRNVSLLDNIAKERICAEFCKLLAGRGVLNVLLDYKDIVTEIVPELSPCIGFEQNNRFHQYTVYDHIAHAVANYHGNDNCVNVALLLHDIGKPMCYTEDENGGHFYGHGIPGEEIAKTVLERLKFDNKSQKEIAELVLYHDAIIEPTYKVVRRWLNKVGVEQLRRLLDIRMADILAHAEGTQESRIVSRNQVLNIAEEIVASNQCFSLKDLAINGNDIMALGVPEGRTVGKLLNMALSAVLDGTSQNMKPDLIKYIQSQRGK